MRKKVFQYMIAFVAILLLWNVASITFDKNFLPSPGITIKSFCSLMRGEDLPNHIWASFYRIALGTLAGLIAAMPVGLLIGCSKKIDAYLGKVFDILYPIPKVVFLPIIVVCLGIGDEPKVFLIALVLFFQLTLTIRDAVRHIPGELIKSMEVLNPKGYQYLLHLVIPACMPEIFSALRATLGISTALLFITENFASITGLGYFITKSMDARNFEDMYAGVLSLALLGVLMYVFIRIVERKVCKWKCLESLDEGE
ncbi:MAG: ABC transporter permease [Pseudobutyrivibrio sp.]|uniref:ABC transporter permease n=1 Tax=Pseudobutyrivibrio sp. TaxID=2014367 RepID=UPI0025DB6F92|nr:ABC transporter permease [Pseudobutyrivibrio sp.]MBE5903200.1 ABC transporter permease [Pseudobutyrivibrio sp.]